MAAARPGPPGRPPPRRQPQRRPTGQHKWQRPREAGYSSRTERASPISGTCAANTGGSGGIAPCGPWQPPIAHQACCKRAVWERRSLPGCLGRRRESDAGNCTCGSLADPRSMAGSCGGPPAAPCQVRARILVQACPRSIVPSHRSALAVALTRPAGMPAQRKARSRPSKGPYTPPGGDRLGQRATEAPPTTGQPLLALHQLLEPLQGPPPPPPPPLLAGLLTCRWARICMQHVHAACACSANPRSRTRKSERCSLSCVLQ